MFCYDEEKHTGNENERKRHFLQHKGNHSNNKEAYTDGLKSRGRKVVFAAVFEDITTRGVLPKDATIHTEIILIKITMKDTKKRRHEMGNICRLEEFNARHQEQRKPYNIKSDI